MTYPFGLPLTWTTAQLGEVCEITQGQSPPGTSYNQLGKGPPFLQGKTEFGAMFPTPVKWCSMPSKFAQMGDVLISVRAPVGSTNMANARYCIGRGLAALRPLGGISNRYIFYGIRATVEQLTSNATGTTFPAITGTVLHRHTIPLPPLAEQHRIVEEIEKQFTRLDAAVEALRTAQAKLKRYRASVLNAAVTGRLVPTEAALACTEGHDYEPASVLLERIQRERKAEQERGKPRRKHSKPVPVDTSNLPGLPEGWAWAAFGTVVTRGEYGTSIKCGYDGEGLPIVRIPNIASGELRLSDLKFAEKPIHIDDDNALAQGDILVCRTNGSLDLVGKAVVVRSELSTLTGFASYLLRFRLVHGGATPEWTQIYMSSIQGRHFIEGSAASSAGQNNVSLSILNSMPIPLSPFAEQRRIVAEVEQRLSVTRQAEAAIETNLKRAARLRQAILKRAFEGRLVTQDPGDEPAAVLLERIKTEKAAAAQERLRRGRRAAVGRGA